MGNTKPWKQKLRDNDVTKLAEYSYRQKAAKSLWFLELHEINTKFEMGLDMDNWDSVYPELMKNDTLGVQAQYGDQLDVLGLVKSDMQESHEVADTGNN
jgi:hypothetical protein